MNSSLSMTLALSARPQTLQYALVFGVSTSHASSDAILILIPN